MVKNILQDKDLRGGSYKWANWMSKLKNTTCTTCWDNHGKIEDISILKNSNEMPVNKHAYCKCVYVPMRTKRAGTVTNMGYNGAEVYLLYMNRLPDYYVNKETAYEAGWKDKYMYLSDALPGKMLGGDIYFNDDEKLPTEIGRLWREADVNYGGGKRNRQRILYSNDGLLFATYDHYHTFYEIINQGGL